MDDLITVFLFTEKAPAIFSESQNDLIKYSIGILVIISFDLWSRHSAKRPPKGIFSTPNVKSLLIVMVSSIFFFVMGLRYLSDRYDYQTFSAAYSSGTYQIAEGNIHVLHTQASGCHDTPDIVQIGDTQLQLSYCDRSLGYTSTIANGGALIEGTYARVYFLPDYGYYGSILRVDVKPPVD